MRKGKGDRRIRERNRRAGERKERSNYRAAIRPHCVERESFKLCVCVCLFYR